MNRREEEKNNKPDGPEPVGAEGAPTEPELKPVGQEPAEEKKDEAQVELETLQKDNEDLKNHLQRVMADYQNYQKRIQRQQEQMEQIMAENLAKGLLPVADDFERALSQGAQAKELAAVLQGVQLVYEHFMKVLEGRGVKRIVVKPGEAFNPARHEAMLQEEHENLPPGSVGRELSAGFALGERVIRPARVSVVAKK